MCGRYALFSTPETLRETFGLTTAPVEPTYNAAPSQSLPVILDTEPTETVRARWGLVPSWSDGPQSAPDPINARAETLTETRHFQAAYEHRRCLVPVDGFYEWRDEDGATVPYFVSRTDARRSCWRGCGRRGRPSKPRPAWASSRATTVPVATPRQCGRSPS